MISRITNCRIIDSRGKVERCSIHISNGKISQLEGASSPASGQKFDAKGRIVLPAFIDCHCHMFSLAESLDEVKLEGSKSISEMLERIRVFIERRPKRSWIFGRGWDQERFYEKRFPLRHDLDSLLPRTKAIMTRICGHVAVMNTSALEFFAKKGCFKDSPSTLVPRDPSGEPQGIVKETELSHCYTLLPMNSGASLEHFYLRSQNEALKLGLAGAHCILDNLDQLRAIRKLDELGRIKLKLSLFAPIESLPMVERMGKERRQRFLCGRMFRVLGFKLFADGSLGARTAALSEDYSDDPLNRGILNYSDLDVVDFARRVKKLHMVLATHAIGDRAVEQVLQAYKRAGIVRADGFRIEHCSVVRPSLVKKLTSVILTVQPSFVTSDNWLGKRIGIERRKRFGYAFKTLGRATLVAGSSDSPVESFNPLDGISSASSKRKDRYETLSICEALNLYTKNAAILSPLTLNSGLIAKGKDCDLVVLDTTKPSAIPHSKVVELFIDGLRAKAG